MRKYTYREDFFAQATADSAYFLGFLAADGNVHQISGTNSWRLTLALHVSDEHILNSFARFLEYNRPHDHPRNLAALVVFGERICRDVIRWGITPRKSLTLKWPEGLPTEHVHHFARGFFDGDGCIFRLRHPGGKRDYIGVNFTGTEAFLTSLQQVINAALGRDLGHIRTLRGKNTYYQLVYSGDETIQAITDWMYQGSTPETRLARKWNLAQEYFAERVAAGDLAPSKERRAHVKAPEPRHAEYILDAFGESKNLTAWGQDPRCVVSRQALYHRIVDMKMDPEDAITLPTEEIPYPEAPTAENGLLGRNAKTDWDTVHAMRRLKKEAPDLSNECIAERFGVTLVAANDILSGRSWPDANYTPPETTRGKTVRYEFQGEMLTLTEIAARTGVPKPTIDRRLRQGQPIEKAASAERQKGAPRPEPQTGRAGGSRELATEVRRAYQKGKRETEILEAFPLSKSSYIDIVGNRTWKETEVWWK